MKNSHYKEAEWPYNLIMDLNESPYGEPLNPNSLPEDFHASLAYQLIEIAKTRPRGVEILRLRYEKKLTWDDIGAQYGLTRERVRQIAMRELRALRYPTRWQFLRHGVLGVIRLNGEDSYDRGFDKGYTSGYEEGSAGKPPAPDAVPYTMALEELDLSVRSYNVLKRAGMKTAGDILALDYTRITRLRNLGKKSYDEIIGKLESLGLDCSGLKPKEDGSA